MTRIYLDVHDRVRVDTTANHSAADAATLDRLGLKLLEKYEELGHLMLREARRRRKEPLGTLELLLTIARMRATIYENAM